MQRRAGSAPGEEERLLTAGTYEGLDPVGHAKDVGMPVIVGGSSGGHLSQVDSAEGLCKEQAVEEWYSKLGCSRRESRQKQVEPEGSRSDVRR